MLEKLLGLRRALWDWRPQGWPGRVGAIVLRVLDALITVLIKGDLSLRATSLVYTTLLTIAPLLALGFSLLKAFGIHNQLEPVLLETLKGLGPEKSGEVARNVMGFVENIDVGVLGFIGILLLLYSAVSLIQKVEEAFNYIWRVDQPRLLSQQFGQYLAVLIIGPLVAITALGATAAIFNNTFMLWLATLPGVSVVVSLISSVVPYALIVGLFTFLYALVPNTRVMVLPAFVGGLVAGLLWQTASFVFATFVAGATDYNAIYSSFAIIILVLIWLQIGWLILLSGCQLAYFAQYPERMNPYVTIRPQAGRAREQLGLALMLEVAQAFVRGKAPPTRAQLAGSLGVTAADLVMVAQPLLGAGVLAESGEAWLPARDPASLPMAELWELLRGSDAETASPIVGSAKGWLRKTEERGVAEGSQSLREWAAQAVDAAAPAHPAVAPGAG